MKTSNSSELHLEVGEVGDVFISCDMVPSTQAIGAGVYINLWLAQCRSRRSKTPSLLFSPGILVGSKYSLIPSSRKGHRKE